MAVRGIVARNEILQIAVRHRVLLQGEVDVGAEVVYPDLLCLQFRARGLLVEEDDVGLDARLVEDAGREPEYGVEIGRPQELLAHGLARAPLEEDVVGNDDSRLARRLQDRVDVLDEVELLVRARRPEVLSVVDKLLLLFLAFLVGHRDRRLFAEGWEHRIPPGA